MAACLHSNCPAHRAAFVSGCRDIVHLPGIRGTAPKHLGVQQAPSLTVNPHFADSVREALGLADDMHFDGDLHIKGDEAAGSFQLSIKIAKHVNTTRLRLQEQHPFFHALRKAAAAQFELHSQAAAAAAEVVHEAAGEAAATAAAGSDLRARPLVLACARTMTRHGRCATATTIDCWRRMMLQSIQTTIQSRSG